MAGNIEIVLQDTPEKFRDTAEEAARSLLDLLRRRNELEREICERYFKLREEQVAAGISPNQATPEDQAVIAEFHRRYLELVEPWCLPGLLKYGPARSFGKPARYDYIFQVPECKIYVTMKSARRAVVETFTQKSWDTRYRFVLRPDGDVWKVGNVDYTFGSDTDWHIDHSL